MSGRSFEAALSTATTEPRDPRVPPVGTVVRRVFDGKTHEVTVCVEGFEYEGRKYKTLSAIATLLPPADAVSVVRPFRLVQ